MRLGVIIAALVTTLLLAGGVNALACMQVTPGGPMPDGDCDGFPDAHDNCPDAGNSNQLDTNRNGVGDACDLLLDEIVVLPDSAVEQGEYARLMVKIVNGRESEMRDIAIRVENTALSILSTERIASLPARDAATTEFWLRVPKCASPKEYEVIITIASTDQRGVRGTEVQRIPLRVVRGDACGTPDGPLDTTIITIFNKVDMDRGQTTVVPLRVQNLGAAQATYAITVDGVQGWAVWRLEPSDTLTLASGQDATGYLFLEAPAGIAPGMRTVTVTFSSGAQKTRVPIDVYVRAPLGSSVSWNTIVQGILIGIIIILIALAIVLAFRHKRTTKTVAVEKVEKRKRESHY